MKTTHNWEMSIHLGWCVIYVVKSWKCIKILRHLWRQLIIEKCQNFFMSELRFEKHMTVRHRLWTIIKLVTNVRDICVPSETAMDDIERYENFKCDNCCLALNTKSELSSHIWLCLCVLLKQFWIMWFITWPTINAILHCL